MIHLSLVWGFLCVCGLFVCLVFFKEKTKMLFGCVCVGERDWISVFTG